MDELNRVSVDGSEIRRDGSQIILPLNMSVEGAMKKLHEWGEVTELETDTHNGASRLKDTHGMSFMLSRKQCLRSLDICQGGR